MGILEEQHMKRSFGPTKQLLDSLTEELFCVADDNNSFVNVKTFLGHNTQHEVSQYKMCIH